MPFDTTDESTEDTDSIWTLFLHTEMYVTAIDLLITTGLGMFFVTSFGVDLPDQHANLYNQVTCDIQLWMMM